MKKIIHFLDENLEVLIGGICLSLMTIFTFANIVMRLLLSTTMAWFQELTRYLFVWMVFISIGACVRYRSHIRITFLQTGMSEKVKHITEIIVFAVCAVFGCICFYYSIPMLQSFSSASMVASSMPWFKMAWLYVVMPIGMLSFVLRNIQAIFQEIKAMKEEKERGK